MKRKIIAIDEKSAMDVVFVFLIVPKGHCKL